MSIAAKMASIGANTIRTYAPIFNSTGFSVLPVLKTVIATNKKGVKNKFARENISPRSEEFLDRLNKDSKATMIIMPTAMLTNKYS